MEVTDISLQIDSIELMKQTFEYLAGLLAVSALVCLFVVWKVRRISVHAGVVSGVRRSGKRRLRNMLLGIQLFICWVFISLAAALYLQSDMTGRTLFNTLTIREKEQILSVPMDFSFMNAGGWGRSILRSRHRSSRRYALPSPPALSDKRSPPPRSGPVHPASPSSRSDQCPH